jgi:hypothetical protein
MKKSNINLLVFQTQGNSRRYGLLRPDFEKPTKYVITNLDQKVIIPFHRFKPQADTQNLKLIKPIVCQ